MLWGGGENQHPGSPRNLQCGYLCVRVCYWGKRQSNPDWQTLKLRGMHLLLQRKTHKECEPFSSSDLGSGVAGK